MPDSKHIYLARSTAPVMVTDRDALIAAATEKLHAPPQLRVQENEGKTTEEIVETFLGSANLEAAALLVMLNDIINSIAVPGVQLIDWLEGEIRSPEPGNRYYL